MTSPARPRRATASAGAPGAELALGRRRASEASRGEVGQAGLLGHSPRGTSTGERRRRGSPPRHSGEPAELGSGDAQPVVDPQQLVRRTRDLGSAAIPPGPPMTPTLTATSARRQRGRRARRAPRPARAAARRTRHTGSRGGPVAAARPRAAGALPGREDGGVVDEAGEQRRLGRARGDGIRQRCHGGQATRVVQSRAEVPVPTDTDHTRWTVAHYQAMGSIPPKRHTQHRRPAGRGRQGELYYEELMGEEGFSSDSSLLYHRNIPSTIADAREWAVGDLSTTPNHPLIPRHLQAARPVRREGGATTPTWSPDGGSSSATATCASRMPWPARRVPGTATGSATSASTSSAGRARVETVFGAFDVGEGDYVVIPRATTHRWIPTRSTRGAAARLLHRGQLATSRRRSATCRSTASCSSTRRTASATCARPAGPLLAEDVGAEADATRPRSTSSTAGSGPGGRRRARCTRCRSTRSTSSAGTGASTRTCSTCATSSRSPGACTSRRRCTRCSRAGTSSICNFVPRKVDYHPLSIPVPYYHSNVDSDEIMFYVDGDYEARKGSGIGKGSISVHPGGHAHGPQPGATEALDRRRVLRRAGRHGRHVPPARAGRGRPRRSTTATTRGRGRPTALAGFGLRRSGRVRLLASADGCRRATVSVCRAAVQSCPLCRRGLG